MDLSNMRRDLTASQDRETLNLRDKLRQCKWEYDHIRVDNNNKEKQLLELAGGLVRYLGVTEAAKLTGRQVNLILPARLTYPYITLPNAISHTFYHIV